jgi:replication factor A1
VEEIQHVLGESVEREKIENELKLFFSYGVDEQDAKRGVIKKLGNAHSATLGSVGADKKLKDIKESDNNLNIKVKIISKDTKTVNVDGEAKEIYYGILADETMSLPYTAWQDFNLERDLVVSVRSAYVKGFRGELQINFGNNTSVEKLESAELEGLTPEKLAEYRQEKEVAVGHLQSGMSNIMVIGRIIEIQGREVMARGEQKTVYSGSIGDATGKVQFSAWHDFNLKVGTVIKIKNCYVKNWRGIPQLTFDVNSTLEFLDDLSLPAIEQMDEGTHRHLIDFEELGGGYDVNIEGIFLELRAGSGIIKRCPECRRVLTEDKCIVHGPQEKGNLDLRVKAIIDDGTGSLMAVLGEEITTSILGITKEEYRNNAEQQGYAEEIINRINEKMLIQRFRLRGNVTKDNYGLMMIAREFKAIEPDLQTEAQGLLDNMGGS